MIWIAAGLACILAGSLVYCVLVLFAVRSYLRRTGLQTPDLRVRSGCSFAPISVLKPLAGHDLGLEENLRSFFTQDYPNFELWFAVRHPNDPAVEVVRKLEAEFPNVTSCLIVTGEPPYPNAKVFGLDRMLAESRHDLLVMSDSDIRVDPHFLAGVASEFTDEKIALATCPYRAIGGPSVWSALEAEGMNTEFIGGLLVARLIEGVKFAVGPTIVARKKMLAAIGGFDRLKDYLAEDFMMGKLAAEAGYGVILSRNVVEHRIGSQDRRTNFTHRLRWNRSTRRSRPAGYIGQLFTNSLPIALLVVAAQWLWWPVLIPALLLRAAAAWSTSKVVLGQHPHWGRLLIQDLVAFAFWIAGFFGKTILWRGRRYKLLSDGRFFVVANGPFDESRD
jgi:ceramide glucosyltransferase